MGRDKRNNQGRLTEKKLSRAKQEDVDNKTTGKADEDRSNQAEELLREPSGAEAYAQNADMERMECTQALSMEVLRTGMRSILREDTTMAD